MLDYACLILALIFTLNRLKYREKLDVLCIALVGKFKTAKVKFIAHTHNIHIHKKFLTHFWYIQNALKHI